MNKSKKMAYSNNRKVQNVTLYRAKTEENNNYVK